MAKNRSGSGSGRLLLGFLLGVLAAGGAGFAYLHFAKLRTTPINSRAPQEKRIGGVAPHTLRTVPKDGTSTKMMTPPFGVSEDVFEAGAHTYRAQCANCHGVPGHNAAFAKTMTPGAKQLWQKQEKKAAVGTAGASPSDIYWKVANGVRQTGMPAYKQVLTETQIWQVSLLLADADKELPDPVRRILTDR